VAALSRTDHVPVSAILNSFAYDLVATAGIAMLPLRRFWRRKRAAERWERLLEPVDSPREIAGPAALDSLWCLEHHTRVHSSVTDAALYRSNLSGGCDTSSANDNCRR
jgi:hypothetical protein